MLSLPGWTVDLSGCKFYKKKQHKNELKMELSVNESLEEWIKNWGMQQIKDKIC